MKKVFYFSFFLFVLCLFTPLVEAKQVVKTCQYPAFVNVGEDGTLSPPTDNGVISLEIYDDFSYKITEGPGVGGFAGSENIKNWNREAHGFPAVTNKGECPDYFVIMNFTIWGLGVDYYAVDEENALDKATDAAGGAMQYNSVNLYKEQNHESQLGIYHCDYQLYTIIVDYIDETLSVNADGNGTLGVFYSAGSNLKDKWFSPDRGSDKCAATISCPGGIVGTSGTQYYVFTDELAAEEAGFDECVSKTCSGDDCGDSECVTYNSLLFCADHNCETDSDDSIEHYYYQIANSNGDTSLLYSEVHKLETKLEAMCEGLMSRYTYESTCLRECLNFRQDIIDLKKQYGIGISEPYSNTCNLSERLVAWIVRIISIVRYIIPALLIVLSVLDFIKAIASDKDDEIKKAGSRFVKRLIVSVILLLLPILIEFALGLFNIPVNDFCL